MPSATGSQRSQASTRKERAILDAARDVFLADPEAPVSAVAKAAGIGMSALYLRFPSKEDLVRHLCHRGLRRYVEIAEAAVALENPWDAFTTFLHDVVLSDVHTLTVRLAGRFEPTPELGGDAARAAELTSTILRRAVEAGRLRADLRPEDLTLVLDMMSGVRLGSPERTEQLRRRYLTVVLDGLTSDAPSELPGPAPTPEEFQARWQRPVAD